MERPYLQPVYDEPEFIVRTVWRLYGGWWDGNPATLKPAPERALAARAGRPGRRGRRPGRPGPGPAAAADGQPEPPTRRPDDAALRLAGHLAELAWLAAPDDPGVGRSPPHGVHPPGRRGVVDHGPRGVLLGGPGVR